MAGATTVYRHAVLARPVKTGTSHPCHSGQTLRRRRLIIAIELRICTPSALAGDAYNPAGSFNPRPRCSSTSLIALFAAHGRSVVRCWRLLRLVSPVAVGFLVSSFRGVIADHFCEDFLLRRVLLPGRELSSSAARAFLRWPLPRYTSGTYDDLNTAVITAGCLLSAVSVWPLPAFFFTNA